MGGYRFARYPAKCTDSSTLCDFPFPIRLRYPGAETKLDGGKEALRWLAMRYLGMPTILVAGPYRMYFDSHEPNEPPHVHGDRDSQSAKFWLEPVALSRNLGFVQAELRRVQRLVTENRTQLLEKRYERFPSESR